MTPALPLELEGIEKSYPGVRALKGVSFDVRPGEVHALVGENGAGKSTLIKVLAGAVAADAGTVRLNGRAIPPGDPAAARDAGIAVIYQEFNLVPGLSAAANVFLGREGAWLRRGDERRRAAELFARIGIPVDPAAPAGTLPVAQQQAVEIARALAADARVLVMDEPTAALTPHDADRLLGVVRDVSRQRTGVIYVSHRLDEVFAVADRVTVLRDGELVATMPRGEVTRDRLIELMVGRRIDQEFPPREPKIGGPRLVVRNLRSDTVRDVSFDVRRGEVLGLTGLVGAGRTEVARLIFGADRRAGGTIELDGRVLDIASPRDAIRAGIALLTEDRKGQGLILAHSVRDNFALPNLGRWSRLGFIDSRRERDAFRRAADDLRIKAADPGQPAATLSGGNQQKLVLAKWLERNCEAVIFDEPTRGIDVGAKYEIYQLVNRLAGRGKAVLLISSELPEVLGMADRALVMHGGRVAGEIADAKRATQEDVMKLAVG
jgi:ABC-type sugar transport system ATPase subunit